MSRETVTLQHAKSTRPGNVVVKEREHDLPSHERYDHPQFVDILTSLQEPCGMYAHEIRILSFNERCQLAEMLAKNEEERFWWRSGKVSIAPHVAVSLWNEFGEDDEQ
jgi:hypothetical protein